MRLSTLIPPVALVGLLFAGGAHAQEELEAAAADSPAGATKVAILDLKAKDIDETLAENLTETFTSEATKVEGYNVISRSEVKDLITFEMEKQALGCDDDSCFTEIGGALGVDWMVSGSVGKVGESFVINVKLINVKRAESKNRVGKTIMGRVELLPAAVRMAAWELFEQPVPADLQQEFDDTKAKLEAEAADRSEVDQSKADADKARAEAEKTRAEIDKLKAERNWPDDVVPVGELHWTTIVKKVFTPLAVVGLVAGIGGTVVSVAHFQGQVGEGQPASDGGIVYEGTQSDAAFSETFTTISLVGYIVGGISLAAAIVFNILEPPYAEDLLAEEEAKRSGKKGKKKSSIQITPAGVAVRF